MVDNIATRVLSARADARIDAFVPDASLVSAAFAVEDAFGSAGFVRIAYMFRETSASTFATDGVRAAWAGVAWVFWYARFWK